MSTCDHIVRSKCTQFATSNTTKKKMLNPQQVKTMIFHKLYILFGFNQKNLDFVSEGKFQEFYESHSNW